MNYSEIKDFVVEYVENCSKDSIVDIYECINDTEIEDIIWEE